MRCNAMGRGGGLVFISELVRRIEKLTMNPRPPLLSFPLRSAIDLDND